jgi:predicted secreted hydrolase
MLKRFLITVFLTVVAAYGSWQVYAATSSPKLPSTRTPANGGAFRLALPGYKHVFPRDHAAHPEYSTEWWYYTGHLKTRNERRFGYELTFFRQALTPQTVQRASKWATRDIIFAHFAITDESGKRFFPATASHARQPVWPEHKPKHRTRGSAIGMYSFVAINSCYAPQHGAKMARRSALT